MNSDKGSVGLVGLGILAVVMIGGFVISLFKPKPPESPYKMTMTPNPVATGQIMYLTVTGFTPNTYATLEMTHKPTGGVVIATGIYLNSQGSFMSSGSCNIQPGLWEYTIISDSYPEEKATTTFTVI